MEQFVGTEWQVFSNSPNSNQSTSTGVLYLPDFWRLVILRPHQAISSHPFPTTVSDFSQDSIFFFPMKVSVVCLTRRKKVKILQRNEIHRFINTRIHTLTSCFKNHFSLTHSSSDTIKKFKTLTFGVL